MKILIIVLFICVPFISVAQVNPLYIEPTKKQADSLQIVIKTEKNDTLRMEAFRMLALYYLDLNSDSTFFYIEKDLPLAKKLKLTLWEADALDIMAIALGGQGNIVKSLLSYNAALQIVESRESEKNIWKISKFTNSKLPEFARLSLLSTIQCDVSGLYEETENYDKQLKVIQDCITISLRINDKTILSQAFRNMGGIYFRKNELDSALVCYKRSLTYADQIGYNKYRSTSYNSIGKIYLKQQLPQLALASYLIALKSGKEQNNTGSVGSTYICLADYYNKVGKNDSALYYAELGLATFQKAARVSNLSIAYSVLATIYKSQKKSDSAFYYLQLSTIVKDSLLNMGKIKQLQNIGFNEQLKLQELEKEKAENANKIWIYSLVTGLLVFLVIGMILYRNNRQKQKTNKVLETTLRNLQSAQSQLIQSEKMASLGELTAGIAHEIQNPLNFVNNFSEVNKELLEELKAERLKPNAEREEALENELIDDVISNEEKINHHGKRADAIVKGMLQHSRSSSGQKEPTDINALCDEYLRLAYHGLRAKDKEFNATLITDFDDSIGMVNMIPQDMGRVILNLINNAFYAVAEKKKQSSDEYEPTVTITTKGIVPLPGGPQGVEVRVADNGNGIPQKALDKIFQPFFTTKPTGQGTGLGLSLSYDIVKAHGGELNVDTKESEGSTFSIQLPI